MIDTAHTVLLSSEHVAAVECLFDRRYGFKNLLAKQDLYSESTYLASMDLRYHRLLDDI